MFVIEGWKLGQIVPQTLPTKKLKRKRDENDVGKATDNAKPDRESRKNPFSIQTQGPKQKEAVELPTNEISESNRPISKNRSRRKESKNAERQGFSQTNATCFEDATTRRNKDPLKPAVETKLTPLQRKMQAKLIGSQFRHINEKLYTADSSQALTLFTEQPSLFHDVLYMSLQVDHYSITKDFVTKFNLGQLIQSTFSSKCYQPGLEAAKWSLRI